MLPRASRKDWSKVQSRRNTGLRPGIALVSLAAALLMAGCGEHRDRREVYRPPAVRITVMPVYSVPEMNEHYLPLIQRVADQAGLSLQYVSSLTYDTYLVTAASQAEFGLQNAFMYVQLRKTQNARPLARALTPEGRPTERGVIVAHARAGISSVSDLRGKRVLLASRQAVAGYMAQAERCLDAGLDPERDLVLVAGIPQDDILPKLAAGAAHAAFVKEAAWQSTVARSEASQLRLVTDTKEYPTWCFAALGETDPDVEWELRQALLSLHPGRPDHQSILEAVGAARFVPATDADYDPVRRLAEKLRIPL